MKGLYVDEGNDAHYAACEKHGIDALYFALRDPRVTRAYLEAVRAKGYQVGVYVAWNWPEYVGTGAVFAEKAAAAVAALQAPGVRSPTFPRVILNDETKDADRICELLARWRQLMTYQATSWSLEGMQGGWHTPRLVLDVIKAKVRVSPQAYTGSMGRIAEDAVLRDLTRRGYPESLVTLTYDAADLPESWNGWAFTMGRLPA